MNEKDVGSEKTYRILSKEDVINLYREALNKHLVGKYRKNVKVLARRAKKGEEIITSIDGEKRTRNLAKSGDFIVRNPSGEEYIVSKEKFTDRYKLSSDAPDFPDYKEYQATGIVWGFQYKGPDSRIEAPWGEEQIVKSGDMIVSLKRNEYNDIYGIKSSVFKNTYEKLEE
jgi:hypothetical protein